MSVARMRTGGDSVSKASQAVIASEDARIRDWHYDGVSVNPMPANNGAYLDFGPQDYKVHLFGALFRYEL